MCLDRGIVQVNIRGHHALHYMRFYELCKGLVLFVKGRDNEGQGQIRRATKMSIAIACSTNLLLKETSQSPEIGPGRWSASLIMVA